MRGFGFRMNPTKVPRAGSAVVERVAVQQFTPVASRGHAYAITQARNWSEVANDQNCILCGLTFSQQRNRAGHTVVAIHPFESLWSVIEHMQSGFAAVKAVQLSHPILHAAVSLILQHVPFQAGVVRPLPDLAELVAHEQQLFFPGWAYI